MKISATVSMSAENLKQRNKQKNRNAARIYRERKRQELKRVKDRIEYLQISNQELETLLQQTAYQPVRAPMTTSLCHTMFHNFDIFTDSHMSECHQQSKPHTLTLLQGLSILESSTTSSSASGAGAPAGMPAVGSLCAGGSAPRIPLDAD